MILFQFNKYLTRRWAYLLALTPVITDWLDTGHLPMQPREYITEVVVGILIGICIWLLYRESDELRQMTEIDSLTGLFNRKRFQHDLDYEILRAHRLRTPLSLAFVDIDEFKSINDERGHKQGDQVLTEVGLLLRSCTRKRIDGCYRIGGDEFSILLVGATAKEAKIALRDIQNRQVECESLDRYGVMLSIGVVELRDGETSESIVERADNAMYAIKNTRKKYTINQLLHIENHKFLSFNHAQHSNANKIRCRAVGHHHS
jgi:diguanylate cyclase (GGDEF)-like protein